VKKIPITSSAKVIMKIKICVPVIGKTLNEFLKNLTQVQAIADMVELRVDEIKNLKKIDLQLIRKKTIKVAILTSKKTEIIIKALNLKFDYVDVDLSQISSLKLTNKEKNRIILSFHNFEKTPNMNELIVIVNNMRKFKTGVIKIATVVRNDEDLGNLFRLILAKKKRDNLIVVGMGRKGKITRVLGPILGSFLTFASTPFGKTAPGQIDLNKMQNIYKIINY